MKRRALKPRTLKLRTLKLRTLSVKALPGLTAVTLLVGVLVGVLAVAGIACAAEHGQNLTATSAPQPVQLTWQRLGGSLESAIEVERETEHGLETWSAEFPQADGTAEVSVLADGTLVSIEREVTAEVMPAAVREHAARALGAAPDSVERLRLAVYELEDRDASGTVRERFVDPFGNVLLTRSIDEANQHEVAEKLADLPAAARAAIVQECAGAELTSLAQETEAGHDVHAAAWRTADGPRELKVLGDGTVLSLELPTGALPARVAALVTKARAAADDDDDEGDEDAAHGRGTAVERMLLDAWEAEVTAGATVRQAIILPTGEILGDVSSEPRTADEKD